MVVLANKTEEIIIIPFSSLNIFITQVQSTLNCVPKSRENPQCHLTSQPGSTPFPSQYHLIRAANRLHIKGILDLLLSICPISGWKLTNV